jgi:hypothetical protein
MIAPRKHFKYFAPMKPGIWIKYAAVIAVVIFGGMVIGDGYLKTRRAEQSTSTLHANVSSLSIQQLAGELRDCDPPPGSGQPVNHDAVYCAEVMRVIEDRPLQAVDTAPRSPPPRPGLR